ncbi:MAG: hypothetical protein H7A36_00550 [Chlamydiales bacterium]|nr:hypothetical protein [Chlamydiales bacterium]
MIYTLPKSGTHFLLPFINSLPGQRRKVIEHVHGPTIPCDFLASHKKVVAIRDPRDFWVSMRDYIDIVFSKNQSIRMLKPNFDRQSYLKLNKNERLVALISSTANSPLHPVAVRDLFRNVTECIGKPKVYIMRFEDFMGEKSGGSNVRQLAEIQGMLRHFGWEMTDPQVQKLLEQCWRKSPTFHTSQIGRWKSEFTPEVTRAFKKHWNKYLLAWGYEQTPNWNH